MDFLLAHWHCVLPVVLIGGFFLFSKRKEEKASARGVHKTDGNNSGALVVLEKQFSDGKISESDYLRKKTLLSDMH